MIDGVQVIPLKTILDERGMVRHMIRRTDPHFSRFGEIYFSVIFPGAIKAWHRHRKMELNYAVVSGNIKLVLWDGRKGSPTRGETQEIFMGEEGPAPRGERLCRPRERAGHRRELCLPAP